jgi:hypothetical protein
MHLKCNTDPRVGTSNDHFYGQSQCRHGQSTRAAERDWSKFHNQNTADPEKIHAIVTRSLSPEYRHAIILNSFNLYTKRNWLHSYYRWRRNRACYLKRVNDKIEYREKGFFTGRIPNTELPELLRASNFTLVCQSLEYQHRYLKRCISNIPRNAKSWITHRKTDN